MTHQPSGSALWGRDGELQEALARIRTRRLVTVTGPGGIGKTALAQEAHELAARDFPLGGARVDLTVVEDPERVPGTIAAQLGFVSFEALVDSPTEQPVLLLVDNCEHVIAAAADAIATLLASCRAPTVLTTSRSPLGLPGESLLVLGPLDTPSAADVVLGLSGSDDPREAGRPAAALSLLVERAVDAGAHLTDRDHARLAELCRELDGVPLALEMAAARLRTLSPQEVLERLRAGAPVLTRPGYRGAPRHRSVTETVRWSYDLLPAPAAAGLERLSVLAGPFPASMARAVSSADTPATDDLLRTLVEASLISVRQRGGGETQYRMLATVRTYARARLDRRGDTTTALEALIDHVLQRVVALSAAAASGWTGAQLAELSNLYEHVVTALRWCLEHDATPERAIALATVLWGVVPQGHAAEVAALAGRTLERWADPLQPGMADVTATLATARLQVGDLDGAAGVAGRVAGASRSSGFASATVSSVLGHVALARGDASGAIRHLDRAVDAARASRLDGWAMENETLRASVLADAGRPEEALRSLRQVREEASRTGADLTWAWALTTEGHVRLRADPESALPVVAEALDHSRRVGFAAGIVVGLRSTAFAQVAAGSTSTAAATLLELVEDPVALAGVGADPRLLLDVSALVLHRAGRPAWADVAATARATPGISVLLGVGHELVTVPATDEGRVLPRREVGALVRRELAAILAGSTAAPATRGPQPDAADEPTGVFADRGELWEIAYAGRTVHARASKGLIDLSVLLGQPHHEVHCLTLVGSPLHEGSPGESLDAAARQSLEQRLRDLQEDVEEAEADHDVGRADLARAEFDAVLDHLTAALGLGGRSRRAAGTTERARSAVTQRIRATIRRLAALHPELGRHLDSSITTGTFCSYRPERPVSWTRGRDVTV